MSIHPPCTENTIETIMHKLLIYLSVFTAVSLMIQVVTEIIVGAVGKYQKAYVEKNMRELTAMFMFIDPKKLFYLNISIMVVFALIGFLLTENIIIVLVIGAIGFFLPKFGLRLLKKKRLKKIEDQLIDTLGMLSGGLRSGMSLLQSIQVVEKEQQPPISQEFGLVYREYKVGVHLEDALKNMASRVSSLDLHLVVNSLNIVLESGGNVTEMLDTLADVIRNRKKFEGKLKALTSQGKLQALIVTALPWGLGFTMYLMDPPMITRMFTETIGIVMIGIMLVLQILGFLMIRKITTVDF